MLTLREAGSAFSDRCLPADVEAQEVEGAGRAHLHLVVPPTVRLAKWLSRYVSDASTVYAASYTSAASRRDAETRCNAPVCCTRY